MLIFIALVYFCVACSVIWLVAFPSGRELVAQIVAGSWSRIDQRLGNLHYLGIRHAAEFRQGVGRFALRQLSRTGN